MIYLKIKKVKFWLNLLIISPWFLILGVVAVFAYEHPRYDIDAVLDSSQHRIIALQKVSFTNNSEIETDQLHFHIYPHRKYSEKEIKFLYQYSGYFKMNPFPEGFQSGDLKIDSVSSQGEKLNFVIEGNDQTILNVLLKSILKPQDRVEIEISFSVDIPHAYGRFGWHKDIISLTRWYPILSVFSDEGWHDYPFYIYHQPFFSEAAYYKLKLTLEKNKKVASSGVQKQESFNVDGTKSLVLENEYPLRDFALGISENFLVYSLRQENIKINSYYLAQDKLKAQEAAENARDLIKYYTRLFGEYPYSEFNIVPSYLGFGGDQSSALIFIDTRVYRLPGFLKRYFDFLISHETGHQWFYNIIGSDEYRQMFLDEGMNSYWLLRYLEDKYGYNAEVLILPKFLKKIVPNFSFRSSTIARYLYMAKNGLDQPVIGELSSFREPSSIFALTYGKGAAVIDMLKGYMGEEKFNRAIQRYAREFRFGNAALKDLIRICSQESAQDLEWFFQQWLLSKKTCDFAVREVSLDKIILENRGSVVMPVQARVFYQDNTESNFCWDGKSTTYTIEVPSGKKVQRVELDPDNSITLDIDRTNNQWPRNFKIKPVPLYFLAYEVPLFLPRDSCTQVIGPSIGGSSLGVTTSLQKPYDHILRLNSGYDFNAREVKMALGYEVSHIFNQQLAAGFEIFDYESSKQKHDLSGGKLYLRKELWPASYGVFSANDHVTLYLTRDKKIDNSGLNGKEEVQGLHYLKKDEAIVGITGSLGRYGPYADPSFGWKFISTQEFAGHFLGGNQAFWRTSAELDNYYLLFPKRQHKLANRMRLGWGEHSDKNLFELGGIDALRGYSRKDIQGAHAFLETIEYRMPLLSEAKVYFLDNIFCLDGIQAVAFFDVGKAWYSSFAESDFKKDVGFGLRFHFNILSFLEKAVVRFDVARPINDEANKDTHYWLSFSQSF